MRQSLCSSAVGVFNVIVCHPADAVFLILYKELYYRHIYAKVSVSNCSIETLISLPL